jgi:hypothetical protein
MILTELTVTRFPRASADVRTNPPDYEFSNALEPTNRDEELPAEPVDSELDLEKYPVDPNGMDEVPVDEPEVPEDPNKAGLIRTVPGAHLAYKRSKEDGTFSELWVYKADSIKQAFETRTAILAGTDIEPAKIYSDDGAQKFEIWSSGNVEFLQIDGLPN